MIKEAIERLIQVGKDDAVAKRTVSVIPHPTRPDAKFLFDGTFAPALHVMPRTWRVAADSPGGDRASGACLV